VTTAIVLGAPAKTLLKAAGVVGGYVAAWLAASGAVAFRVARLDVSAAQASSGMHAFGDSLLFLVVFSVVALVPTGVALSLLRDHSRVWGVLSMLGLAIAVTGVTAAVLFAVGRNVPPSTLATLAGFSVLRILVAPVLALTFLVCTLFVPRGGSRSAFVAATVMETVVSVYGGFVWFAPLFFGVR
jgi:hypothetical protein